MFYMYIGTLQVPMMMMMMLLFTVVFLPAALSERIKMYIIQTARVPKLLDGAKILPKNLAICSIHYYETSRLFARTKSRDESTFRFGKFCARVKGSKRCKTSPIQAKMCS